MTPEEEIQRADQADVILRNEMFKEAVKAVEEALLTGIRMSAFKDSELREKLCQQYILLHSVIGQLKSYLETGRLAQETIKQRNIRDRIREIGSAFR